MGTLGFFVVDRNILYTMVLDVPFLMFLLPNIIYGLSIMRLRTDFSYGVEVEFSSLMNFLWWHDSGHVK